MPDAAPSPASIAPPRGWWVSTVAMQIVVVWLALIDFGTDGSLAWHAPAPAGSLALSVAVGAVILRSRAPWAFLAIATALNLLVLVVPPLSLAGPGYLVALLFAVYATSVTLPPLRASMTIGAVMIALAGANVAVRGVSLVHGVPVTLLLGLAIAASAGQVAFARRQAARSEAVRSQIDARLELAHTRARDAHNRLSAARDLHDALGHSLAVINLQSEIARNALPPDAHDARRAIERVHATAQTALDDVGEIVLMLRGEQHGTPRLGPSLHEIARALQVAGAQIEMQIDLPPTVPTGVENAVTQVVQEALVNAHRHGDRAAPIAVDVDVRDGVVHVRVTNRIGPGAGTETTGVGLRGIRERVDVLGGRSFVRTDGDRFTLEVEIPMASTA